MNSAPALEPAKLDQIAALPLGGRVKLNAWDDRVELIKMTPVTMTSGPRQDAAGSDAILPPPHPLRCHSRRNRRRQRHNPSSHQLEIAARIVLKTPIARKFIVRACVLQAVAKSRQH